MTDDEIDAVLMPELARYLECENGDLTIMESARIAFRAGMRRAARIARERQLPCAAAAIERAAGGER